MKLFISIFIVASLVFIYTLFNTGFSRILKPDGGYNEGFQNSCDTRKYKSQIPYSPLWFILIFIVALLITISLDFSKK